MKVGYTGSRDGMTPAQMTALHRWMSEYAVAIEQVDHGDCIGGDSQFDDMVRELCNAECVIVSHPSNIENKRANVHLKAPMDGRPLLRTVVKQQRPPILRDCDVVEAVDVLLAAPKTSSYQQHSGTWFTYTYAMKHKKATVLFYPDGEIEIRDDRDEIIASMRDEA